MVGAIGKWEVLSHPVVTIRCFGWAVFFRAMFASPDQTFLSLLTKAGLFEPVPEFIGRCVDLETGDEALRLALPAVLSERTAERVLAVQE